MGNRAERIKAVKDRKKEVGSAVKSGVGLGTGNIARQWADEIVKGDPK